MVVLYTEVRRGVVSYDVMWKGGMVVVVVMMVVVVVCVCGRRSKSFRIFLWTEFW